MLEERPTPGAPQNSRNRKTLIKEIEMIIREIFLLFQLVSGSSWVEPNVKINIPKEVKFDFFILNVNFNFLSRFWKVRKPSTAWSSQKESQPLEKPKKNQIKQLDRNCHGKA